MHLRRAAERVRVLHLVAPAVRLDDRRALEQREHVRAPTSPCPRSGRSACTCGMNELREPCSASSESAHAMSAVRASRWARTRPSAPCAAMNCVPLIEREALLGLQRDRREAGALERLGAVDRRSPSTTPRPRRRAAAPDARAARGRRDAPTEPRPARAAARHGSRHSSSSSTVSTRAPGVALRERVRAQQHRRAHDSSGYGSPTPQAWERSSRSCSSSVSSSGI